MSLKLKPVTNTDGSPYGVSFVCPGCGETHVIPTGTSRNAWSFNGDMDAPTLSPSILAYPHPALNEAGERYETARCHSFVTDGRIQFLGDCTHALAGQTVALPEVS